MLALTRAQFDAACKAYANAHRNGDPSVNRLPAGWLWTEHAVRLPWTSRLPQLSSFIVHRWTRLSREDRSISSKVLPGLGAGRVAG